MDVARCYDSITPEAVGVALRALGVPLAAGEEIVRLLDVFRGAGVSGIPIGPEPSAILANAVLAGVDERLRSRGLHFVRWVDDFVLSARSLGALGAGELAVEAALAEVGLVPNPAKHHRFQDPGQAKAFVLRRGAGAASALEILLER